MNPDLSMDDLLAELVAREEAMASFAAYIEYVSGMKPPPHLKLICDKLDEVAEGKIQRLMSRITSRPITCRRTRRRM